MANELDLIHSKYRFEAVVQNAQTTKRKIMLQFITKIIKRLVEVSQSDWWIAVV